MYTVIGQCPKCGAPIYTYTNWSAVTPPPSIPSCSCNPQSKIETTTNTAETKCDENYIQCPVGPPPKIVIICPHCNEEIDLKKYQTITKTDLEY